MYDNSDVHQLILYCTDLDYFPADIDEFIAQCQQKQLLANLISVDETCHYLLGERFMQYVSFVGCSPYLKLAPESEHDENFSSAVLPCQETDIQFFVRHPTPAPNCPKCKKPQTQINELVQSSKTTRHNSTVVCISCHKENTLSELDWRRNAAFCRFYIAISHIYPKEAIPTNELMDWLSHYSDKHWQYCYV